MPLMLSGLLFLLVLDFGIDLLNLLIMSSSDANNVRQLEVFATIALVVLIEVRILVN
jgi:hypothetical protein